MMYIRMYVWIGDVYTNVWIGDVYTNVRCQYGKICQALVCVSVCVRHWCVCHDSLVCVSGIGVCVMTHWCVCEAPMQLCTCVKISYIWRERRIIYVRIYI